MDIQRIQDDRRIRGLAVQRESGYQGQPCHCHRPQCPGIRFSIPDQLPGGPWIQTGDHQEGTRDHADEGFHGDSERFPQLPSHITVFSSQDLWIQAKKGYFPHFFNTSDNEDYEGPLPDHQYYGTSTMTTDARTKFFDWYTPLKNSGYVFNLKKERWVYCDNDVYICAKAIMEFRSLVKQKTEVDPLLQAMTIASTTSIVYRQNFLPENTIGLIPPGGYKQVDTQSETAFIWLKYVSESENIRIQHARNGGEKVIHIGRRKYHVDGYAEVNGEKTVYEFHGCKFHGCPRCYKNRQLKIFNESLTMEDRFQNTLMRIQGPERCWIQSDRTVGMQLDDLRKKHPGMDLFFNSTRIHQSMDPRMAFFGGRTNATKLYHEFKDGEKGHYADVCSLYPTTLMYDAFPLDTRSSSQRTSSGSRRRTSHTRGSSAAV